MPSGTIVGALPVLSDHLQVGTAAKSKACRALIAPKSRSTMATVVLPTDRASLKAVYRTNTLTAEMIGCDSADARTDAVSATRSMWCVHHLGRRQCWSAR